MTPADAVLPYERQLEPDTTRTCGAACLSMVYRSFGLDIGQGDIAAAVSRPNRFGSMASTTHLMARDALTRGFEGVAIQARHPLQTLRLCRDAGIRVVLNHRLSRDSSTGHYSALVDIDDTDVILHDPFFGPSRHLSHGELLDLWQPRPPDSEIVGNMLIAIAAGPTELAACRVCGRARPSSVDCPRCAARVDLQPGAVLGCIMPGCVGRLWNYVCCPACDFTWTFSPVIPTAGERASTSSPDPQAAATSDEDPFNLGRLFGELDRFCGRILSLPAAAGHPEIRQQLDFINASRDTLKLAQAERIARRKASDEQMARLNEETERRREAHRQKLADLETPSAPLDGDALSRALLRSLGLPDWRQRTETTGEWDVDR
jgi:hypothetical protein